MGKRDLETGRFISRSLADRFWEKVDKQGPDECWEWIGGKHNKGYGQIQAYSRLDKAHRVSWMINNGPIPENMCVLHHCDNPSCVNPAHLWLGTNADNVRDKMEKGREAHNGGEKNGSAKLTEPKVRRVIAFLDAGYSHKKIAAFFNVSRSTITFINTGGTWGIVTGRREKQCIAR